MFAWDLLEDILNLAAVGLLLFVLVWAATERARAHGQLGQLRRVAGVNVTARVDSTSLTER